MIIKPKFYEIDYPHEPTPEPHSDEVITSDEGYVDVAQQIESMILAGQLLQESRPNSRNMIFEYNDDDSACADETHTSAVDTRGSDIVDLYREADTLSVRVNQAKAEQAKSEQVKAEQAKAEQVKAEQSFDKGAE